MCVRWYLNSFPLISMRKCHIAEVGSMGGVLTISVCRNDRLSIPRCLPSFGNFTRLGLSTNRGQIPAHRPWGPRWVTPISTYWSGGSCQWAFTLRKVIPSGQLALVISIHSLVPSLQELSMGLGNPLNFGKRACGIFQQSHPN